MVLVPFLTNFIEIYSFFFSQRAYEDLRETLRRRYLLRPVALELFSNDGRSCLVAFDNLADREEVHRLLAMHMPGNR